MLGVLGGEGAVQQRTDYTSTNGLVARGCCAGPDTNRSIGLHSLPSFGLIAVSSGKPAGDWGQVLLVAIGKQHSPRAKPHSESRQASGKT